MLKNRLLYALFVAFCLLFVILHEHSVIYRAIYVLFLLPLFTFLLARMSRKNIHFSVRLSANAVARLQTVEQSMVFKNKGFLPISTIKIQEQIKTSDVLIDNVVYASLSGKDQTMVLLPLETNHCGIYEIDDPLVTFYDLLGLFKFKLNEEWVHQLVIKPRVLPVSAFFLSEWGERLGLAQAFLESKIGEPLDLRKFRPTDSPKQIHWKASVKKQELISKNEADPGRAEIVFMVGGINLKANPAVFFDELDLLLEGVVSIANQCFKWGYELGLHAHPNEKTVYEDFISFHDQVSQLNLYEVDDLLDTLSTYEKTNRGPMQLFVFLQYINDEFTEQLERLNVLGYSVSIFVANASVDVGHQATQMKQSLLSDMILNRGDEVEYEKDAI